MPCPATRLALRLGDAMLASAVLSDSDSVASGIQLARVETLDIVCEGRNPPPDESVRAVARVVDRLPALRAVTLCFHGTPDPGTMPLATGLIGGCTRPGLALAVELALGEDASALAAVGRGAATPSTSLTFALETSRRLRLEGVAVRWMVPLVPALVYRLEALFSLAHDEGVDPVLTPARCDGPRARLDGDERLFACDFITNRLLQEDSDGHQPAPERARTYRALDEALRSADVRPPDPPCPGAVLRFTGDAEGRWPAEPSEGGLAMGLPRLRGRLFPARAGRLVRQAVAVGGVLLDGSWAAAQWMRAVLAGRMQARPSGEGQRLPRVLLIGAYGGDHIGDTAVLGGVLVRLKQRYGTSEAVLMSQRPAHTRHLIAMLEAPIVVEVAPYERAAIREHVSQADAVVFAGGPLIDLPKQLVRHLYTASLARLHGKPFIVEGIGPGPFPRWPSKWTARRIVSLAERISVRTSRDAKSQLLKRLAPEVGRDPAFDYLRARGRDLSRLQAREGELIEHLLEGTRGRVVIGLNLRPIRHLFTVGAPTWRRASHTRAVEARFEERVAEGLRRFDRASPAPPCFVFFPMNPVQFGMSDLRSAYRLARALGGAVDLRVWEGDPSLDGIIALLRRLDVVIAMRFHAAVFALSQGRPVIGIDYRIGARDKVAALLDDMGQGQSCCRIDEMTAEWLLERLVALTAPLGRAPGQSLH